MATRPPGKKRKSKSNPSATLCSRGPPILRIPDEVLLEILSYVLEPHNGSSMDCHFFVDHGPDYRCYRSSVVFTLRWTCRKIRRVVARLPFWYNNLFDPLDLFRPPDRVDEAREAQFLNILLADDSLRTSLGNKRQWHFRDLGTLLAVIENVPAFRENATQVEMITAPNSLYIPVETTMSPSSIEFAILSLAICQRLVSLVLFANSGNLNLEVISQSCPHLRRLKIVIELSSKTHGS